jgi:hypothetical protein
MSYNGSRVNPIDITHINKDVCLFSEREGKTFPLLLIAPAIIEIGG